MKIATPIKALSGGCVILLLAAISTHGQTNKPVVPAAPAVIQTATNAPPEPVAPADLSKGATDIIKLFRGGKKDNVLVFYANNAGLDYKLSADDIIYFTAIGISKPVITAMMESDKERAKAIVIQPDFDRPIVAQAAPTIPETAANTPVQPPTSDTAGETPATSTIIYPDYSAYPDYYQTFDNSDQTHTHVSVSIGIGVGVGFGPGDSYHGYGGHGGHFGGRH